MIMNNNNFDQFKELDESYFFVPLFQTTTNATTYTAAPIEAHIMKHLNELGFNTKAGWYSSGCGIWHNNSNRHNPRHDDLLSYAHELNEYKTLVGEFQPLRLDLRSLLFKTSNKKEVCQNVDLNLSNIFSSGQLSQLSRSGLIEPLLPPLRHPKTCLENWSELNMMDPTYLVHDFEYMCLHRLKPQSRIVYFDLGASLQFHANSMVDPSIPALSVYLYHLYHKFGFHLDHIYAYEYTRIDPNEVFDQLPSEFMAAYHWINVGVNNTKGHALNPWTIILRDYNEDDFIIVKLDIDTPDLELSLANQLLKNDTLMDLVDQFYFEYHVHMRELRPKWRQSVRGSMKDSMELFTKLRERGVAAHSWV